MENDEFKGIECIRMELGEPDDSGRRRPVPIEGSEFLIECDNVISAIGQTSDLSGLKDTKVIKTDWSTIEADPETLVTGRKGVFAGGDVVAGPANVVTAIAHGKRAAISIDQYLRGQDIHREYCAIRPAVDVEPVELTDEEIEKLARPEMPCVEGAKRVCSFVEVEKGFDREMAVIEAKRCLRCDRE